MDEGNGIGVEELVAPVFYDEGDEILKELNHVTPTFTEHFENQRRAIGASFQLQKEIILASKKGVVALKKRNYDEIRAHQTNMTRLWQRMGDLDIPKDKAWQFDAEAGQELCEFFFAASFYEPVFMGGKTTEILGPENLKVTEQSWLAGLGDGVGEVSKMVRDYLLNPALSRQERKEIRWRFLGVARQIHRYLEQFETAYPMVIDNSRRRGYRNTFRGLLGYVENIISRLQDELIQTLDQESK